MFIGDEILGVNDIDFDGNTTHDKALKSLRESGDEVTLRVRHHKAANILRKRWRKDDNQFVDLSNDNPLIRKPSFSSCCSSPEPLKAKETAAKVSNNWKECVRMELFLSNLSQYVCYSDKLRDAGFEVKGINGQSVVVQCDNEEICHQWCQTITNAIQNLTITHVIHCFVNYWTHFKSDSF